jgi:hypothetical protein
MLKSSQESIYSYLISSMFRPSRSPHPSHWWLNGCSTRPGIIRDDEAMDWDTRFLKQTQLAMVPNLQCKYIYEYNIWGWWTSIIPLIFKWSEGVQVVFSHGHMDLPVSRLVYIVLSSLSQEKLLYKWCSMCIYKYILCLRHLLINGWDERKHDWLKTV